MSDSVPLSTTVSSEIKGENGEFVGLLSGNASGQFFWVYNRCVRGGLGQPTVIRDLCQCAMNAKLGPPPINQLLSSYGTFDEHSSMTPVDICLCTPLFSGELVAEQSAEPAGRGAEQQ